MKFGSPPPPPPDDEAADPLLAALRQRLGDYAQAPSPGAWAAIRQQIKPVALPRPWWRRPGRLLPVLGLLLGWLLPGILGEPLEKISLSSWITDDKAATLPLAHRPVSAAQRPQVAASATVGQPLALPHLPDGAEASKRTANSETTNTPATRASSQALATTTTATRRPSPRATLGTTEPSAVAPPAFAATAHTRHRVAGLTVADNKRRISIKKRPNRSALPGKISDNQLIAAINPSTAVVTVAAIPGRRRARNGAFTSQLELAAAGASTASSEANRRHAAPRLARKDWSSPRARLAARRPPRQSGNSLPGSAATQKTIFSRADTGASAAARLLAGRDYAALSLLELTDSLALKQTSLLLPALGRPPMLAARPDSTTSVPHPVRRWALLLVAGPTLSYRTLGPAPALAAGHPDFARLERPALGLGAQVQVRRVLSGRWALAVGVGYHEYATRLALAFKDSAAAVRQRDTYRLLTVPVQLSYALGAPKGKFTKALLLGTEPGWYLGGRSTEGADCGCQQQAYSAAGSPYRTWSLAFSLGLDLRYRVGGPNSRWQWLVQPTGRYVATPFVRSDAVGFTKRQPWSLGLMTGFSWDVR